MLCYLKYNVIYKVDQSLEIIELLYSFGYNNDIHTVSLLHNCNTEKNKLQLGHIVQVPRLDQILQGFGLPMY